MISCLKMSVIYRYIVAYPGGGRRGGRPPLGGLALKNSRVFRNHFCIFFLLLFLSLCLTFHLPSRISSLPHLNFYPLPLSLTAPFYLAFPSSSLIFNDFLTIRPPSPHLTFRPPYCSVPPVTVHPILYLASHSSPSTLNAFLTFRPPPHLTFYPSYF